MNYSEGSLADLLSQVKENMNMHYNNVVDGQHINTDELRSISNLCKEILNTCDEIRDVQSKRWEKSDA